MFTLNDADVLATLLNALLTLLERRDGATLGEEVGRVEGIGIVDAFVEFIFNIKNNLIVLSKEKSHFKIVILNSDFKYLVFFFQMSNIFYDRFR